MQIDVIDQDYLRDIPGILSQEGSYGFGVISTELMLIREFGNNAWSPNAVIGRYANAFPKLHPHSGAFHYGFTAFDGLKAFKDPSGKVHLFRPEMNTARFNRSASRVGLPEMNEGEQLKLMKTTVGLQKNWVPNRKHASIYVRPTIIGVGHDLGYRNPTDALYFITLTLAEAYFGNVRDTAISLKVETERHRVASGGTGDVKVGGNYGAGIQPTTRAQAEGFNQVLWTGDGPDKEPLVEEAGVTNFFLVEGDKLITPESNGKILEGVTRDSIIKIARLNGVEVEERPISVKEMMAGISAGKFTEAFTCGTASVIIGVGQIGFDDERITVGNGLPGKVTIGLFDKLTNIQFGLEESPFEDWLVGVD